MAENLVTPSCAVNNSTQFKEAVCIEAGRIFDSCSDKDCLEDLQVYFTAEGHAVIDQSALIKVKSAEVLDVYLNVEPVAFNRGYYAVDMTFYFRVTFSAYASPIATPVNVRGLCFYSKRVILYGSEGNVKTFYSGNRRVPFDLTSPSSMPTAAVKVVDPITLGSRVCEALPVYSEPLGSVPEEIMDAFDGIIITGPGVYSRTILVTLGVFTIVTLERSAQLMIPCYDYSIPEKDCQSAIATDDPCEMFRKIKFPVDEFFPDSANSVCDCNAD